MTSESNFERLFNDHGVYDFETRAPQILGAKFVNAKSMGTITYELAKKWGFPVDRRYRDVYPSLPVGTLDAPTLMAYTVFKLPSGAEEIMCSQWVNKDTIVLREYVNAQLTWERISPARLQEITRLLQGSGNGDFSLVTS